MKVYKYMLVHEDYLGQLKVELYSHELYSDVGFDLIVKHSVMNFPDTMKLDINSLADYITIMHPFFTLGNEVESHLGYGDISKDSIETKKVEKFKLQ